MKCPKCQERYEKTKYISTVECRGAEGSDGMHGMILVWVGASYIGKKYRVIIEEARDESNRNSN